MLMKNIRISENVRNSRLLLKSNCLVYLRTTGKRSRPLKRIFMSFMSIGDVAAKSYRPILYAKGTLSCVHIMCLFLLSNTMHGNWQSTVQSCSCNLLSPAGMRGRGYSDAQFCTSVPVCTCMWVCNKTFAKHFLSLIESAITESEDELDSRHVSADSSHACRLNITSQYHVVSAINNQPCSCTNTYTESLHRWHWFHIIDANCDSTASCAEWHQHTRYSKYWHVQVRTNGFLILKISLTLLFALAYNTSTSNWTCKFNRSILGHSFKVSSSSSSSSSLNSLQATWRLHFVQRGCPRMIAKQRSCLLYLIITWLVALAGLRDSRNKS